MAPWLTQLLPIVTELLKALACLAWPVGFILLIYLFKGDVRALIRGRKLKRTTILGQVIELEEEINQLEKATKALPETAPPSPSLDEPPGAPIPGVASPLPSTAPQDIARQVLAEAGSSPKAALMLLASEIETELRRLLESYGAPIGSKTTFRDSTRFLQEQGELPREFLNAMIKFRDVRNRIIHGYEADPDDVLRAIDLGLGILRAIRALRRRDRESESARPLSRAP
jgi:hypothetical protein